ncbi:MAG: leucine-rich repeat domain-containing protein [Prevotella sp.]|nr:leucine-rich repeat domain-containing protein [Prevotella sp.]
MLTLVVSGAGYAQKVIDGINYKLDYIDNNWHINTGEAEVIEGKTKYSGDVVIPATLDYNNRDYTVTRIGINAFTNCWNLNSVTIPNSVTSIGACAFTFCNITSVTVPNSITSIEESAFSMCGRLTSVTIPNSITSIENATFFACQSFTSIAIPNSVTSIGNQAFSACISLTSVTIPNSVKSLGEMAFDACCGLKWVSIPESLTDFDKEVFNRCDSLITVVNLSKTPQNIPDGTFSTYGTLHVLPGCKAAYEAADVWKNFTIVEDADQPAEVIAVNDLIAAIGKVENTEESKAKITAARSAYDALTKEQQALVKNFNALVEAEKAYKQFETTGIASVETKDSNKNGKYIENGNIVIVKNGKNYNINGQAE